MQLPHFFEPDICDKHPHFNLSEETSKHCVKVLRMRVGEGLQLLNGKGLVVRASLLVADKKNAVVKVEESVWMQPKRRNISIAISLLKNTNRFEWFVEKAVEIGVDTIIPLICSRTEKIHFRKERMMHILTSAMMQSKRSFLTDLRAPLTYDEFIQQTWMGEKFIAHCGEEERRSLFEYCPVTDDAMILIGPEGDFTSEEIAMAFQKHFQPVSLGNTRLRAETAGVYSATLLCV